MSAQKRRPKAWTLWALIVSGVVHEVDYDRAELLSAARYWGPSMDPRVIRVRIIPVRPRASRKKKGAKKA